MDRLIIYDKNTKLIIANIPCDQSIENYFYHYPEEYKNGLDSLRVKEPPKDLFAHKIVDGVIVMMGKQELYELGEYGKVLSEEERLLEQLRPSHKEVKKAENTIEVLTLIKEVM